MSKVTAETVDRELLKLTQRFKSDLEAYAQACLTIRGKDKIARRLIFNRAQQHIHAQLEAQKKATGKVRALILKGRQQGCSTYVGARYYHQATHGQGARVYILTHQDTATQNLFDIVKRYHDNCPDWVQPSTGNASAKELFFNRLDSGYKVGTAATKGTGRSATIQYFHGSECAFWPHADDHIAGVLQAVPDAPGSEIILESTANGVGGTFHSMWRDAETPGNEFIAIFVPWFWQEEYARSVPAGFVLDEEEQNYARLYGLSPERMAWRRVKIAELRDPALFKQEYPANAAEAFQQTGHDSFIRPALIANARKAAHEPSGPLIIGFDPAWKGDARHSMAQRRGRKLIKVESRRGLDTMQSAGWLKQAIDRLKPVRVFIDVGGVGAGVYDRLVEMDYGKIVRAVNFGSSPMEPPPLDPHGKPSGGPVNRRAEMWMKSREWLEDPAGVQIPDMDSLQADACGPSYKYDSHTRLQLEGKDQMRARGVPSPDEWDAVALTFAEPVSSTSGSFNRVIEYPKAPVY